MVDLGSSVGLAISCLQSNGRMDLKSILPALDFYAYFLGSHSITTICVILDPESGFYWFGSTLHAINRDSCANRRRQILDKALFDSATGVTLPVVPPYQQRRIGQFIRNHVVHGMLAKLGIVDNTEESTVGIHYTELLNMITKPRDTDTKGEQWQFKSETERGAVAETEVFKEAWGKILNGAKVPEALTPAGVFDRIEKRMNEIPKGLGQRYGHCAETYPLIFILGLVSLPWPSPSPCRIIS